MESLPNSQVGMVDLRPNTLVYDSLGQANSIPGTSSASVASSFPAACESPSIERILLKFSRREGAQRHAIMCSSLELTQRFRRYLDQRKMERARGRGFSGAMNFFLAQLLGDYIDEHIDQKILMSELADLANLSIGHFHHAFSGTMGDTPYSFVMNKRIEVAQEIISSTDAHLTKIGAALGFNDNPHFSREFRHRVGLSPTEWRQRERLPVA